MIKINDSNVYLVRSSYISVSITINDNNKFEWSVGIIGGKNKQGKRCNIVLEVLYHKLNNWLSSKVESKLFDGIKGDIEYINRFTGIKKYTCNIYAKETKYHGTVSTDIQYVLIPKSSNPDEREPFVVKTYNIFDKIDLDIIMNNMYDL